jgi:hypothetical protein
LPDGFEKLLGWGDWLHRYLFFWLPLPFSYGEGVVTIGPIPKGTPVTLLTNIDLESNKAELVKLLLKIKADLKQVAGASDDEAAKVLKNLVPDLIKVSKCPDYVVNKGHYFGTSFFKDEPPLSDDDKWALIEYLKTF